VTTSIVTDNSYVVGGVDFQRIHGQPGVGFYRLNISVKFLMQFATSPDKGQNILKDITGQLVIPGHQNVEVPVCRMLKISGDEIIKPDENRQYFDINFEAELDRQRLYALEEIRQNGDFWLLFRIEANAHSVNDVNKWHKAKADIRFQATQSDWNKVLEGMKFRKTILLEIPSPDEVDHPDYSDAVNFLTSAYNHLSNGNYRNVVADCRLVLESISPSFDQGGEISDDLKQLLKTDTSLTKDQRLARVNALLIKLTHLAHHTDDASKRTEWKPIDAQSILAMTTSLVRLASGIDKSNNLN